MNIGVICDVNYSESVFLSSYFHAVNNLFNSVKLVNNIEDLHDVDLLFCGNEHYMPHRAIWDNDAFIEQANKRNIPACIYTAEYIHTSLYPWNRDIQKNLEKFKFLHQRVIDVDDSIKLNKKIARCCISRHYKDAVKAPEKKLNKCLFIGKMYPHRQVLCDELKKTIELDIAPHGSSCWNDYINTFASYRFILSPYSNDSNSFHFKFYESLLAGSIPVHQVYDNTLDFYTYEASYKDAIYFKNAEEVAEKISKCDLECSFNKPWLEDELKEFFSDMGVQTDKQ